MGQVQKIDVEQVEPTKKTSKISALALGAFAYLHTTMAMAAISYTEASKEIKADIDASKSFGVEIGLAILGFIAVISILRHVRGAVR